MNDLFSVRPILTPNAISQTPKSDKSPESVTAVAPADDAKAVSAQEPSVNAPSQSDQSKDAQEDKAKTLQDAVKNVNDFVQTVQRDLHFSVDEESERMVVKVVEASSGDIIRQIPDESFLELARKMKEFGEMQLVNAKG